MNKKRILELANIIEAGDTQLGFNMESWQSHTNEDHSGHGCGTTACIGGWAVARWGTSGRARKLDGTRLDRLDYHQIKDAATDILDLDRRTARFLMIPGQASAGQGLEDIPQAQAVVTLRHLAETGEVKW